MILQTSFFDFLNIKMCASLCLLRSTYPRSFDTCKQWQSNFLDSAWAPQIDFRNTPLPTPTLTQTLKLITSSSQVSFIVAPWCVWKPFGIPGANRASKESGTTKIKMCWMTCLAMRRWQATSDRLQSATVCCTSKRHTRTCCFCFVAHFYDTFKRGVQ